MKEDPDVVAEVMAGLTNNLYDALNEKMKSTTMSSALTFYNDKEMTKQMTQYKKDIKFGDVVKCRYTFEDGKHVVFICDKDENLVHAIIILE